MKRLLVVVFFLAMMNEAVSQQQMSSYTQYLFNPYLINPSLVAASGRKEINILYRQQWTGVEDAPKTLQADIQYPITGRMAVAFSVGDDRTILLSRTSITGGYSYKIPLNKTQAIGFGISAGIFSNRIRQEDVSDIDLNDPVLNASNSVKFNAQAGVHYTLGDFYIGVSAMQLIANEPFGNDEQVNYKITDNMAWLASYRFAINRGILLQPNVAYRMNANSFNYLEGSLVATVHDKFQFGAGYRQHIGPLLMARVKFNDFQLGYSYDFPSRFNAVSTGGSHEFQLKYSFGTEASDQYDIYKNYNKWYRNYKNKRSGYRKAHY